MKLAKTSMITALLLSANVYAVDNVEVSGDVRFFYGTQSEHFDGDATLDGGLFGKESSYADAGLSLGVTADMIDNVKAGAKFEVMSRLGMDNSIAEGTWSNAHESDSGALETTEWMSEAWIEGKLGNTTATVGRQIIETPLVFTETWSVDYNTFEAAVLVNEDIPDTTLVGAWIGKSNGVGVDNADGTPIAGNVVSKGGKFKTIGSDGAGVLGVTNNSIKPLAAQAWYYELPNTAKAYWLQADLDVDGFLAGAQYTTIDMEGAGADDSAYALMVGYAIPDTVTFKAAYSSVDDEGTFGGVYNIATDGQSAGTASSLYTEFWWWFQTASVTGADTMTLSAEGTVADVDLFLGLYSAEIEVAGSGVKDEVDEITFTASKSFGPLDTSIALIHDMFDSSDSTATSDPAYIDDLTTIQVYLTYNF